MRIAHFISALLILVVATIALAACDEGESRDNGDLGQAAIDSGAGVRGDGQGIITAAPDSAIVTFPITRNPIHSGGSELPSINASDLFTEENLAAQIEALVAAGAESESVDIQMSSIAYSQIMGTLAVTADIEDLPAVAQAGMDAFSNVPGTYVSDPSATYLLSDCEPFRSSAAEAALHDATENARSAADLAGLDLGEIIGLSNYTIAAGYDSEETACRGDQVTISIVPGAGPIVPPGEVRVSATISVTYALEQ